MNAPIVRSLSPAAAVDRERVLAGDIGGTSTRLAIFERNGPKPRVLVEKVYSSKTALLGAARYAIAHAVQSR